MQSIIPLGIASLCSFHTTNWRELPATCIPGETGFAPQRTQQYGDLRVRLVEYSTNYKADHWCSRGHILFCVDGEMDTEFQDGSVAHLKAGTSYQVTGRASVHRSTARTRARCLSSTVVSWRGNALNTSLTKSNP